MLSHPDVTSRFTAPVGGCADTRLPAGTAGAQDTAVQPRECALSICIVTDGQLAANL